MRHININLQGTMPSEGMLGLSITESGEISIWNPENGTDYKLKELQTLVDGTVEVVYLDGISIEGLGDDLIMLINEEGLMTCEPNQVATSIWQHNWIHGNVLITQNKRFK